MAQWTSIYVFKINPVGSFREISAEGKKEKPFLMNVLNVPHTYVEISSYEYTQDNHILPNIL